MSHNITIRRALPNDAELISCLSTITFAQTHSEDFPASDMTTFVKKCFSPHVISMELNDKYDFYFIAFANDAPAGYMRLKEDKANNTQIQQYKALELKRVYVLKEYHSKKIVAALMKFALEFATLKKFSEVRLNVYEHNAKAKNFYKNWGFQDTGITEIFHIGNTQQTDNCFINIIDSGKQTAGISL